MMTFNFEEAQKILEGIDGVKNIHINSNFGVICWTHFDIYFNLILHHDGKCVCKILIHLNSEKFCTEIGFNRFDLKLFKTLVTGFLGREMAECLRRKAEFLEAEAVNILNKFK